MWYDEASGGIAGRASDHAFHECLLYFFPPLCRSYPREHVSEKTPSRKYVNREHPFACLRAYGTGAKAAGEHEHGDRYYPEQRQPSTQRAQETQQRDEGDWETGPGQPGRTPVLSVTTELTAISAEMPTKAKRYIHPESPRERKPS